MSISILTKIRGMVNVSLRMQQAYQWKFLSTSGERKKLTSYEKYGYKVTYLYASSPATMFALPYHEDPADADICFVGVPFDSGVCGSPGARLGPKTIRAQSSYRRHYNYITGAAPYDSLKVVDSGDVEIDPFDIKASMEAIRTQFETYYSKDCKVIAMGGDHTITYPILHAIKERHGPVGLIHVDAHDDTEEVETVYHGSPFYHAGEEGCYDHSRVVQIGLRSGVALDPHDWSYARSHGFKVVPVQECRHRSLAPLMAEVRQIMGDQPVYLSFDIDAIDLSFAPGTGTPEIAGLTTIQAVEIIQGCSGLNLVGCDLVEVSPPLDTAGVTATIASQLLFEMLCVFPGVHNKGKP